VESDLLLGQATEGVVESVDPDLGERAVVRDARLGVDLVPVLGDRRVVDLQGHPGVDAGGTGRQSGLQVQWDVQLALSGRRASRNGETYVMRRLGKIHGCQ
jgi:hypothetical protein